MPERGTGFTCLEGETTSSAGLVLAAGAHAVVLLCDGDGTLSVSLEGQAGSDPVELPCAAGQDPAVARVLDVEEAGPAQVLFTATGASAKAAVLVPVG